MLPIPWKKPFNTDEVHQSKNRLDVSPLDVVGLRILIRKLSHGDRSNVVVKTNLKSQKPSPFDSEYSSSFLRWCHLCRKALSPHKDVYMYRGDQGFCSEECRNRQIYMDEMEAIEASTKRRRKLSASSSSSGDRRCETLAFLEQTRRRRHNPLISYQKNRPQVS